MSSLSSKLSTFDFQLSTVSIPQLAAKTVKNNDCEIKVDNFKSHNWRLKLSKSSLTSVKDCALNPTIGG